MVQFPALFMVYPVLHALMFDSCCIHVAVRMQSYLVACVMAYVRSDHVAVCQHAYVVACVLLHAVTSMGGRCAHCDVHPIGAVWA